MPSSTQLTPSPALLAPVLALNAWTFFMEGWMYYTRIPAVTKFKVPIDGSATKEDFNKKIPPSVRWKADNYNHLMEQPTQFYAVALTLAMLGVDGKTDLALAWGYVGLRVAHSLVQCLGNKIMRRFQVFVLSSGVLAVLTARAWSTLWAKF